MSFIYFAAIVIIIYCSIAKDVSKKLNKLPLFLCYLELY